MKKYLSQHTPTKENGEAFNELSLTVPNMALDIDASIKRMQQGLEVRTYVPQWDEDLGIDLPVDFEKMDRTDRLEWAARTREQIETIKSQAEELRSAKQESTPPPPENQPDTGE